MLIEVFKAQYSPGAVRRMTRTEKEMFVCPRPCCTHILFSLHQLEEHIEAQHSKHSRSSEHIQQEFSFDQDQGDQRQDIQEDEFEFEQHYQNQKPDEVKKKDDVARIVPVEMLNVLIDLLKEKREQKKSQKINIKIGQ